MNQKKRLLDIQTDSLSSVRTNNCPLINPIEAFSFGPSLAETLCEIGPLPLEALFMGQAMDGLPILLDLHDPTPGPILILGEPGTGKTDLLRVIAQFVITTHTPSSIQFAVITERVEEWQERISDAPHCVGVFFSDSLEAKRLVYSLASWISRTHHPMQSVLLLLDGLEDVCRCVDLSALQQVLICGPKKRVWPIVTASSYLATQKIESLEQFRTRLFAENPGRAACLNPLFRMQERGNWLTFQVPSLGF